LLLREINCRSTSGPSRHSRMTRPITTRTSPRRWMPPTAGGR
jgi:hypothetical protein